MPPKHKLALLIGMTLIVIVLMVYTTVHHNYVGLAINMAVLAYYIPHYVFAIRDLKRLHGLDK